MNKLTQILFGLYALAMLAACDEFDPGSLIEDTRVLGVQVSVVDDPERASPLPGETAEVRVVVASPEQTPTLRWAFVACAMNRDGSCAEPVLGPFQGESAEPRFLLEVPSAGMLGHAESLQLLGVVCDAGEPALDGDGQPECSGKGAHGTALTLNLALGQDDQVNHNPRVDNARITLDGKSFAADTGDVAQGSCSDDDSVPQLKANGKEHKLTLELDASVREQYREEQGRSEQLEDLQISHFVTAGELERQFSFVEDGQAGVNPRVKLSWDAPKAKAVAEGGELVRFVFVVRDLRGGLAVTERALCVTP
jgi:hypothetical protein